MSKQGGFFIFILIVWLSGCFCYWPIRAEGTNVIINEVAWMGTAVSANDEWVELYNPMASMVNLTGWTLVVQDGAPSIALSGSISASGYFLLERTDDETVPNIAADLIYAGALGNAGEALELRDAGGNTIDNLDMAGGWQGGDNTTKQTLARSSDGGWHTSATPGGTPRSDNIQPTPPSGHPSEEGTCGDGAVDVGGYSTGGGQEECDDGNTVGGDGCDAACRLEPADEPDDGGNTPRPPATPLERGINLGDVVVNEFVSDPADGEVEWVELYNTTLKDMDLTGWTIEDGSGAKTALSGIIAGSGMGKFKVIEKPKGNLNNSGDIMILRDKTGKLIDQVAYGNWNDGDTANNAPAAADPLSVARKIDGYNTHNNINDFSVTTILTKGKSNVIVSAAGEEEISAVERVEYDYSDDIVISEIMPNPAGSDEEGEFIELYNRGTREVDLTGWKIGDESKKNYIVGTGLDLSLPKNVIKAGEFKVFYRTETKLALNNGNESVKLYQPLEDLPLQTVKYEKAIEDWSFNAELTRLRQGSGGQGIKNLELRMPDKFVWSEIITPGKANVIKAVNHAPMAEFDCPEETLLATPVLFDSSDTIDEDGDKLAYAWDFGDGATNTLPMPEHTYFKLGTYTVKLAVNDGENTAAKEKVVKVVKVLTDSTNTAGSSRRLATSGTSQGDNGIKLVINEILPDPEGADEDGEWIELYNSGGVEINMLDWRLDDEEGGSKAFQWASEWWFGPGKYRLVERSESGLALNNAGDTVRLFDSAGDLVDEAEYGQATESEVYARGENGKWFWSTEATPDGRNIITVSDSAAAKAVSTGRSTGAGGKAAKAEIIIETTLEKIREMEIGDVVKVSGVVAVLPGILGSQFFYIVGSPGVQVYSYKKDFPKLAVGDIITVTGELSQNYGEWRVKTKTAADMVVESHGEAPLPTEMTCDKIVDECAGELVTIAGEITDRKSSTVYFDDGTSEAVVYIKAATGIAPSSIKEGRLASITGIVNRTTSGVRVMPRSSEDIVYKDAESEEVGTVLGEVAQSDEWELAARDKRLELFKYFMIAAGAVIVILVGLLFKARKR